MPQKTLIPKEHFKFWKNNPGPQADTASYLLSAVLNLGAGVGWYVHLRLLTPDEREGGEGEEQDRVGGHQGDQQPRVRHVVRVDGPAGREGRGAYSVWERMNRMAEMVSRPMMVERKMSFIRKKPSSVSSPI